MFCFMFPEGKLFATSYFTSHPFFSQQLVTEKVFLISQEGEKHTLFLAKVKSRASGRLMRLHSVFIAPGEKKGSSF